ncbi:MULTISPECIES: HEAT repeat domain-containing protein [unclassified Coleofasciculus]|uniref:HEAT repeat domain-containing protein n=1 Tax=unclassified Coleofasciculus TaxID=2692782 RepID=UPI001880203C|nr:MULTISPECIES: HEAT repeat domain-containing protein [unclassified Coleofasciculus]MBE9127474.1 HEAT repeat domain-containing protein [Coleofasciculus sp. LEGE 07081]MBE9150746.1 HEAT repeat domain-containing protein [Coleofasciculus sp. LEGE 07092]
MSSRLSLALSLLTILMFLADETPAAAQRETFSLSPSVSAMPGEQETAKPIVVADLVEQLRTANVEKRRQIIQQLSDSEQDIVPALVNAMDDPDPLVKSGVAEVLGNLTDAAVPAIPALIEMIDDGRRAIVPGSSYSGLYSPSQRFIIPPVPALASVPGSATVQERRFPSTPPSNPENLLRITAIAALGKIGLPARTLATPPLTQALQDPDPWVKLNATWALSEIGASVPLLSHWLEALQHPDPTLRRNAASIFQDSRSLLPKVLGAEADSSTTAELLMALKDEDFTVRDAATQALELLGTGALSGLVQGLKAPEPLVRLQAAKLVGNLGGAAQSAVPDLLLLLEDTGRYVPPPVNRYGLYVPLAIRPLRLSLPGSESYPPAPDNPEQLVRVNAAIALGKLGDRSAIAALSLALEDNNPWMQLATSWALLRLGQIQGLPVVGRLVLHPDSSIQEEALFQLQGYGSQATPYLLPYYAARLDSADDNIRNNAIIRIGKFGPAALNLVPKLRSFLVSNQKDSPGYAATILGEIARDTATAWLNGHLSDNQRLQAIAEFTPVLSIMQAPNARFNREPVERVRYALTTLRGVTP